MNWNPTTYFQIHSLPFVIFFCRTRFQHWPKWRRSTSTSTTTQTSIDIDAVDASAAPTEADKFQIFLLFFFFFFYFLLFFWLSIDRRGRQWRHCRHFFFFSHAKANDLTGHLTLRLLEVDASLSLVRRHVTASSSILVTNQFIRPTGNQSNHRFIQFYFNSLNIIITKILLLPLPLQLLLLLLLLLLLDYWVKKVKVKN